MALAVFTALFAYSDMMWPLIVNMNIDKMTLAAGISSLQGQHSTEYPIMMAGSALAMIPMLVLYLSVPEAVHRGYRAYGHEGLNQKSARGASLARSACQKSLFDKLVDGGASSPATATPTSFCLKSFEISGRKTARKRFLLWKMGFSGAKIAPCPPYTPLGSIESSRGLRPSRALRGF